MRLRTGLWLSAVIVLVAGCSGGASDPVEDSPTTSGVQPAGKATPAPSGPASSADSGATQPEAEQVLPCGIQNRSDGSQVVRYCGEARVKVRLPQRTVRISGGECQDRGQFVIVNVGTNYSDPKAATGSYLGLLMGPREAPGLLSEVSDLELTVDGEKLAVTEADGSLRVRRQQVSGQLTGRLDDGHRFRLSLTCATG